MSDPEVPQFPPIEPGPGGENGANGAQPASEQYDTIQGERLWGMLAYMLTFVGFIIPAMVLYAVKREQSRFISFHALQSILLQLGSLVLVILFALVLPRPFEPLIHVITVANLVYVVLAAVKAYDGEWYRIPVIGDFAAAQVGAPR